ncbi:MAG: chromosome segregation protein SMC [Anaerolineaceae bacterium]|nr:chromosome segregation protein SMC [Anaerolineaceae bacterium]
MVNRLVSLEMQGFKTFATITRLEFPGQVTAIVGPNGSGKSNISDSIRWVLGEQSYSLLRAKKTEDMIFSGSQQKPRAGMASVTLTFNNMDGWLPIEYAEVSISRRAYRDGQNEYLLNGQKVRLKDISELLAQTGLAEMSYTIIGQGLVDVALALKPDERRQLFEEAAGIGLYRSRKEEALRRLETTRKNLDRVLDIMTEIKPRLRSLERQSSRFVEYQQHTKDLQVLLREWYGYHWHQKQQDLQTIRRDYQEQEKQLSLLRKSHEETSQKVEESRLALSTIRRDLEAAHNELSGYHRQLEETTRELAIIDERRRSYNQQRSELEIDFANAQETVKELELQETSFAQEIEQRLAEYDAASDEVNQADLKLSDLSAKREIAEKELETTRNKRVALEKEIVQITAHVDELRSRLHSLEIDRSKVEDSVQRLNHEKETLAAELAESEKVYQNSEKQLLDVETEISANAKEVDTLRQQKYALTEVVSGVSADLTKVNAQLSVLEQAEAALSGYSEGSKAILEDARKGRLPKGIEPLSTHLIVAEKYERAVSAALGELTDLLLVPSDSQDMVINYLEARDRDRVALYFPNGSTPANNRKDFSKEKGFIGYANELVQAEPPYQQLVETLLSDILIVEDRASAFALQPKIQGSQRVVTLNGFVLYANGVLIGGQSAAGKRIGRTREKTDLLNDRSRLEEELTAKQKELQGLESALEKAITSGKSLTSELRGLEQERNRQRKKFQETRDGYSRLEEQLAWHQDRVTEIVTNSDSANASIQADESKLEQYHTQIDELLAREKQQHEAVNGFQVFDLQQDLNHWQTHQIVTKNALEAARQRQQDHQKRLDDAHQRLVLHQERLNTLTRGLADTKDKETDLREVFDRLSATIKTIEDEKITPFTSAQTEADKTLMTQQKQEEQSHQQVIIAERQYTQLQLELSRRNDQLQNLQQRIEDDFGLVSYEYEQKMDGPKPLPFDDGIIENLPRVKEISPTLQDDIKHYKTLIRRIGAVNPEAQQEYLDVKERFEFLTQQIDDLEKASKDLQEVIDELDGLMERDFIKTFKAVNIEFKEYFTRLFNGGEAQLVFSDEENPVEGGVDIEARLPGRRSQGLSLLSGGERSLTAVALIFALLKVSPTPFCILDEVDAMLDESNVGRFIDLLKDLSSKTQFVIITHNRNTVQAADVIYGVTMGRDSTSQMISLKLEEVDEAYLE